MSSGFDVAEALHSARSDRALLRFVQEFAATFAQPISDGDGVDESELDEAEERLGVRLPAALREAYLLFGRRADLTQTQDPLLPPRALKLDATGTVLVFRIENQSCAAWGVPLDSLDQDDPPVQVERYGLRNIGSGWSPFLEQMSLAVVELVLQETALGRESRMNMCELPVDEVSKVLAGYSRMDLPDYRNWAVKAEETSSIRWYSAPGRLLRIDEAGDTSWLLARGQRKKYLKAMVREISGQRTLASGRSR